jgi:hypothetical protein
MPLIPFLVVAGMTALLAPLFVILFGKGREGKPRIEGIQLEKPKDEIVIVASEDIALDNQQGSDTISSEHNFSCSAGNSLSLQRTNETEAFVDQGLLGALESGIARSLRKRIGLEVNEQINRSVRIRFNVAAAATNRYRIIWKQQQRSGHLVFSQGAHRLSLPFSITYGLSHEVLSLPLDKQDEGA